jgi:hypothetical protein
VTINNNTPYSRKKISTLLILLSATILMLLATSPLLLFTPVPAQAQSSFSFRTTQPANGAVLCSSTAARLTFDAQGMPSSSNPQHVDVTGGTFQISDSHDGQILYSGNINTGRFANSSEGGSLILYADVNSTSSCASTGDTLTIDTACGTSNENPINIGFQGVSPTGFGTFRGAVECSQGGENTQSMTGSSQDGDGDGILDANDNCPNLPYTRCYQEGDTAIVVHNSDR